MPPKAKGAKGAKGAKLPEGRTCAVCGVPAANTCGGCHQVTYCSADHQRQHWKSGGHKAKCAELKQRAESARVAATGSGADSTATAPSRRPTDPTSTAVVESICHGCEKRSGEMKLCARCEFSRYCSVECQRGHWSAHKKRCPTLIASKDIHNRVIKMECAVCLQPLTTLDCELDAVQILDCEHHLHAACWIKVNSTAAAASVCPVCRQWVQSPGQAARLAKSPHWVTWPVDQVIWTILGASYQAAAVAQSGDPEGAPEPEEVSFILGKLSTARANGSYLTIAGFLRQALVEFQAHVKNPLRRMKKEVPVWVLLAMVYLAGPETSEEKWVPFFLDWWGENVIPKAIYPQALKAHAGYVADPESGTPLYEDPNADASAEPAESQADSHAESQADSQAES